MNLYHYSCAHTLEAIGRAGRLLPLHDWRKLDRALVKHGEAPSGLRRAPSVIWLTDLPDISRAEAASLGLTSFSLRCDRTRFRYTVDGAGAVHWLDFVATWKPDREWLACLHQPPAAPERWWVATFGLPVVELVDRYSCRALVPKAALREAANA